MDEPRRHSELEPISPLVPKVPVEGSLHPREAESAQSQLMCTWQTELLLWYVVVRGPWHLQRRAHFPSLCRMTQTCPTERLCELSGICPQDGGAGFLEEVPFEPE